MRRNSVAETGIYHWKSKYGSTKVLKVTRPLSIGGTNV